VALFVFSLREIFWAHNYGSKDVYASGLSQIYSTMIFLSLYLFNIIGIKQDLEEQLQQAVDIVSYRKNMNEFLKRRIDNEAAYV